MAHRPQYCLERAAHELTSLLPLAVQQMRRLMASETSDDEGTVYSLMSELQDAWDDGRNESTCDLVQEYVDAYRGKTDCNLCPSIAGWLECAKLVCTGEAASYQHRHSVPDSPGYVQWCQQLRAAVLEQALDFDQDEQEAMRSIASVRHCDFEGRWYHSEWPGVFAAVDGLLETHGERAFDRIPLRDGYSY